ncbi:hypothetical protein AVEN_68841-1 [Araneus ventricosus]|uniref:DNA-directed DNA polymerase n=1 Tax=Araneus ventricosus TaxID=182803 RepID=A0A4Y2C5Y0_ARAVE|nr:hypothetical protein AVEN_68841-1 [Araneus ventricosus]
MQEKFLLPSSTICELINAVNEFQTDSVSLTKQSIVETLKESNVNENVLNLVLNNPAAKNAVIINERNRRINRRYNAEEVTFQARIDIEQIPSILRITSLVAAVEAVRKLITLLILRCANESVLYCTKAILYALAHLENNRKSINALRAVKRPILLNREKTLHRDAGVPLGPCTYKEIEVFEQWLNVQMVVISSESLNQMSYRGKYRSRRINLYLHNDHFDVIKSLKGFYGADHYCESCDKPYGRMEDHRCPNACYVCFRTDCVPGQTKRCDDCDRLCQSEECFQTPKEATGRQKFSLCDKMYQCRKRSKVISRWYCPKESHRCETTKCSSCRAYVVAPDHYCFLQTVAPKAHSDHLIFFDFETDQSSGIHEVNFAVAQYFNGDEMIFKAYDSLKDFCSWLFSPVHKNFTVIAHNMKGYVKIASACMAAFRAKHLVQDTIAMVPIHGYINRTKFSHKAICWLNNIAFKENVVIQHALNQDGEKSFNGLSRGWVLCGDKYCLLVSYCFDGDALNPLLGLPMNALFEKIKAKSAKLQKAGYILDEKWEHEFRREIELVAHLQKFVQSHDLKERLNPKDAFYGGRTNAVKLYFEGTAKRSQELRLKNHSRQDLLYSSEFYPELQEHPGLEFRFFETYGVQPGPQRHHPNT